MSDESIFINRELSWLDFNRRVLALGKDKNVPLGERIKFLAIYGSNLDEFFMVRVGSLQERANLEQSKTKKEKRENKTNMTAAEQLAAIMPKTAQLQEECDKFYAKALENLAENGYHKVDFDHLTKEEEHLWKKYFQSELFPILSPLHILFAAINSPLSMVVHGDALTYGILPIVNQIVSAYGIPAAAVGAAFLITFGPAIYIMPMTAATYMGLGLTNVELKDHIAFSYKWAFLLAVGMLAFVVVTGVIPF